MDFLQVKGQTRSFTTSMDIREVEKRLDALTAEKRTATRRLKSRVGVEMDRRSHNQTNFRIDKNVGDYWYIVASGVLEQREPSVTTVTFHTHLGEKGMIVLMACLIVGVVMMVMGTPYAWILPLAAIGGFLWSHFPEGNALARLVEEALQRPLP
jgi:hypothetical protein